MFSKLCWFLMVFLQLANLIFFARQTQHFCFIQFHAQLPLWESLISLIYQFFSFQDWDVWVPLMKFKACFIKYFYCYIFERCHLFKVFTTSNQIINIQVIPYFNNFRRILLCVTFSIVPSNTKRDCTKSTQVL